MTSTRAPPRAGAYRAPPDAAQRLAALETEIAELRRRVAEDALYDVSRLRVTRPCPRRWEELAGDDRRRHCDDCGRSVHAVEGLTVGEVEALFAEEGSACVSLRRRGDGTVVVGDCPDRRRPLLLLGMGLAPLGLLGLSRPPQRGALPTPPALPDVRDALGEGEIPLVDWAALGAEEIASHVAAQSILHRRLLAIHGPALAEQVPGVGRLADDLTRWAPDVAPALASVELRAALLAHPTARPEGPRRRARRTAAIARALPAEPASADANVGRSAALCRGLAAVVAALGGPEAFALRAMGEA